MIVFFAVAVDPPNSDERNEILKYLWDRISEFKIWVIFSALAAAVSAGIQVQTASLVKKLFDQALVPKKWDMVVFFGASLIVLFLIDGVADFLHRMFLRTAAERTVRKMRNLTFDRFLIFSENVAGHYTSGAAVNHVITDVFVVSQGLHVVADVIREPLVLIGLFGYLFYLDWRLTMVCLIAIPVIGIIGKVLGRLAHKNQASIQSTLEKISNHIVETMRGLRTAHAFGQTRQMQQEFRAQTDESYRLLIQLARIEESVAPLTKWITSWIGALLIGAGGYLAVRGHMTTGDLVSFVMAAGLMQQPLRQLNNVNVRLQQVLAAAKRIYQVEKESLDAISVSQDRLLKTGTPASSVVIPKEPMLLEYRDLSYRYPSHHKDDQRGNALSEVNLTLTPGRRLALVGRSGSGKTTLSLLAMRLLDPTQGQVQLGGKNAKEWDLLTYRSHFSYVSQDVFLFNRSLRENLLFAKTGSNDTDMWTALERANIRDFVEKLPRKLETNLGELGSSLSGGEKQRISIARAFLRNSPILVLDEATSNLDAHSERAVQGALYDLMENRSVIVVAHRLSTIKEVDEVAVFDSGRLVEQGAFEVLVEKPGGHFADLWATQHKEPTREGVVS